MHRRLLASTAAAALIFGLAACADEPAPPRPPSINIQMPSDGGGEEAAPSDGGGEDGSGDEAEPTTEEHAIPAPDPADFPGMDEHTPEGAEQAARYFVAELFWAFQTGDTSTLDTLYESSCGICIEHSEEIVEMRSTGSLWAPFTYSDSSITSEEPSDYAEIIVSYNVRIYAHDETANRDLRTLDNDQIIGYKFAVNWREDGWKVSGMGQNGWEITE